MPLLAIHHLILFIVSFTLCVCEDAENVFRAVEGETVDLPCHSPPNNSELVSVEWTKYSTGSTALCKLNINIIKGSLTGDCFPHFKVNKVSFTLSIENVQPSDSDHYSCKTTRIIPPPSLGNTINVKLQVAVRPHLSLQKLNSSIDTCVHLLCSLESLTPEQVNFTWGREGHGSLHPLTSYAMNSELHLCKPDWSDGDTITCYASYSSTQTQYSRNIKLDFNHEAGQTEIHLPVCVVLFSIFIISIVFIWMLFFILQYKDHQHKSIGRT